MKPQQSVPAVRSEVRTYELRMSCSLDSAGKLEKQVDNLGRNREGTSPGPQLKPTAPSLETENCHRCCRRGLDRCPCPLLLCITSSRTKSEPGASDRPGQGSVHTRPPGRNGKGTSGFFSLHGFLGRRHHHCEVSASPVLEES